MRIDVPVDLESLEEDALRELRERVTDGLQDIQSQLGNQNQTDADGKRVGSEDFWEWRHRAKGALRIHVKHLRRIKAELARRGVVSREDTPKQRGPSRGVLLAAMLATEIGMDVYKLTPQELDDKVADCVEAVDKLVEVWNRLEGRNVE